MVHTVNTVTVLAQARRLLLLRHWRATTNNSKQFNKRLFIFKPVSMFYRNLFVRAEHKGFSFFMGSCLVYTSIRLGNSWITYGENYEMLRHPVLGALTFMVYQETHTGTATMTCGSICYVLLLSAMLCFDDCKVLVHVKSLNCLSSN